MSPPCRGIGAVRTVSQMRVDDNGQVWVTVRGIPVVMTHYPIRVSWARIQEVVLRDRIRRILAGTPDPVIDTSAAADLQTTSRRY